jgi:hypothetical protein
MAITLGAIAGCSDSTGPGRVGVTFVLREAFLPFQVLPPSSGIAQSWMVADTLVFQANGTGERKSAMAAGGLIGASEVLRVSRFRYDRDGDTWTIHWGPDCLPACDIQPPAPTTLTLRDGVAYLQAFGVEFVYDLID